MSQSPKPGAVIDNVVSLAKRRGFVYPCGEIYGGTRSAWDYGPLGVELKENIKRQWWRAMVQSREDVVGLDSSVILPTRTWEASGHLSTFSDPLVECQSCHKRYREDHLQEDYAAKKGTSDKPIDPDTVDKSMYDVLAHGLSIKEVIKKREIDVACSSIDLAGAEIAMSTMIGRERALERAFAPIKEDYDFICIDTPPSLGLLTINALTAADKVIVPVQCEYLSMRGLIQLQNTLEMIRENLNPEVQIEGILPTLVDSRTLHAKEAIEILEENFGELVYRTRIRKTVRYAEAPVKGSSVLKYDPSGAAAEAYRELAREIVAAKEAEDGAQARKHA